MVELSTQKRWSVTRLDWQAHGEKKEHSGTAMVPWESKTHVFHPSLSLSFSLGVPSQRSRLWGAVAVLFFLLVFREGLGAGQGCESNSKTSETQ